MIVALPARLGAKDIEAEWISMQVIEERRLSD
jgi:hypothetical protein